MNSYECDKGHGTVSGSCPQCVQAFKNRRDAATMTAEERAAEFEWWGEILTIPFSDLHQRIEELAQRPVWTHELAHPEQTIAEIRSGKRITLSEVIEKIPEEKRVVVVLDEGKA